MTSTVSVSLSPEFDGEEHPGFSLKLQRPDWELNIWMTEQELALIPNARAARWDERGSVEIGKCLDHSTFWSCENGHLTILVGPDDESWVVAVTVPEAVIDDIIAETERERQSAESG